MNVVDSRCESHDHAMVNGRDEVVPRIVEELPGHARVNGIVEDVGTNCKQNVSVLRPEDLYLHTPA